MFLWIIMIYMRKYHFIVDIFIVDILPIFYFEKKKTANTFYYISLLYFSTHDSIFFITRSLIAVCATFINYSH